MIVVDDSVRPSVGRQYDVIAIDAATVLIRSPDQGVRASVAGTRADDLAEWLRMLDGTRTAGELRRERPLSDGFETLLRELVARGIVRTDAPADPLTSDARLFAQYHDDPIACRERLVASRVAICGGGRLATLIRDDLTAAGVGRTEVTTEADGRELRGADLVIACLATPRDPVAEMVAGVAASEQRAWLPVLLFGGSGFVGPLFVAGDGPCHECLWTREQANWADPELTRAYYDRLNEDRGSFDRYGSLPVFESLISQWTVLEATKFLSRFTIPVLFGSILRIDFMRASTQRHRVLKVPRCRGCSPATRRPQVDSQLFSRPS